MAASKQRKDGYIDIESRVSVTYKIVHCIGCSHRMQIYQMKMSQLEEKLGIYVKVKERESCWTQVVTHRDRGALME